MDRVLKQIFSKNKHTQKGILFLGMVMLFIVLVLDQASKYWILYGLKLPELGSIAVMPGFNLTMVWNNAITFGMLNNLGSFAPVIFSIAALCIACTLFIGGAIGNIIDRLRFGAVVDFIHLYVGNWSWYVFNIADSAIVCGVGVLLIDAFFIRKVEV